MNKKILFDNLVVVKRSGQRTSFQGEKIAIAIQKAFASIDIPYQDEDVNKIYAKVLDKIEVTYQDRKTINIENIQDIIEETLKKEKFLDVYEAFSTYRNHRNASRKTFVIKQQHKFLKAIESLGLNNMIDEHKTNQAILKKFGTTISLEFAKAYLLDNKLTRAHDSGSIYLHSIETMPTGAIENLEIDLTEIEQLETPLSQLLHKQSNIYGYLIQLLNLIEQLANEQYSDIAFIHLDKDLETIGLKQFQTNLLTTLTTYIKTNELDSFISLDQIQSQLEQETDINHIFQVLQPLFPTQKRSIDLQNLVQLALDQTKVTLQQAFTSFFSALPNSHISINFGTATSFLGNIINQVIIETMTSKTNIQYFFKIKNGINYHPSDPNYPIFQQYKKKLLYHNNCYLIFLDASFNQINNHEEVSYFNDGKRVIEDNTTLEKKLVGGKGNLATVSINLVRIALKCQNEQKKIDKRIFYQSLEQTLLLAKDALLARFELQCNKPISNFPLLYENGLWHDGEKIKANERLRKLLKHGTLTIHFCGLNETIQLLNQEKSEKLAVEIVQFMRKKLDQFSEANNLNFSLSAISYETIATEFKKQDTAIYGKIKGITDKEQYSIGDNVAFSMNTIGQLQSYLNGGHLLQISITTESEINNMIEQAKESNIGCLQIIKKIS